MVKKLAEFIGIILAKLFPAWWHAKRKPRDVEMHGANPDLLDDISNSISSQLSSGMPERDGHREASGRADADYGNT